MQQLASKNAVRNSSEAGVPWHGTMWIIIYNNPQSRLQELKVDLSEAASTSQFRYMYDSVPRLSIG